MKTKKLLTGLILSALMITGVGLLERAQAATTDTIDLKVTVAVNLSVDVSTTAYDFGTLTPNETKISTGAILISNDSTGATEDLRITGGNSTNWTAGASTNTT